MNDSELISKIASLEKLEMIGDKPSPMFGALVKTAKGEDFWHPLASGDIVMRLMLKYDVCISVGFRKVIACCFRYKDRVVVIEQYDTDPFIPSCKAVVKCIIESNERNKGCKNEKY